MTTQFYNPTNITQQVIHSELNSMPDSIEWITSGIISPDNPTVSSKPLYTISGLWMEKFLSKTHKLVCTDLKIPFNTSNVTGIEFLLEMNRSSRIEDFIIQLTLNGELIGDNIASPVDPVQANMYTGDNSPLNSIIGNFNVYGNPTNMWGTTLTSADISNTTFGIVIAFRSNQIYPHQDFVYLNRIGIGITYG